MSESRDSNTVFEDRATTLVRAFKDAGIDFLAIYPDSELADVQRAALRDPDLLSVRVASEMNGVAMCAGAWLGGKRPALLIPTAGLLPASWPLVAICQAKGIPLLLMIGYRGEIGDATWYMGPYFRVTTDMLDTLGVPFTHVDSPPDLMAAIDAGMRSAIAWMKPVALLLARNVVVESQQ